jgi:DNA repair exonuclease SbcCD ATPase subunit
LEIERKKHRWFELKNIIEEQHQLELVKQQNKEYQNQVIQQDVLIQQYESNKKHLQSKLVELLVIDKDLGIEYALYSKQLNTLQTKLIQLKDKKGIPYKLLSVKIESINQYVNEFLNGLVDYQAYIYFRDKNDTSGKIDITIQKHDLELEHFMLSGYELFMLNIAIKRALNKYSFNSKSSLICIDEGLDVIDVNNFKKLPDFIKKLRQNYCYIFMITHIEKIQDYQDNSITIIKNGKFSEIA